MLSATADLSRGAPSLRSEPVPWIYATRSLAVRLFLTCWLVYALHVATNTVREIYLALAIADHFSFRVDDYANMHPDLFEKKGYGWHIGANPGASLLGAIPYAALRPVTDRLIERINRERRASGLAPPAYNSPWPMARAFFEESWRRGYDVKFGLAAIIMQALCMAPISAAGVVAMFYLLRRVFGSDRTAVWLAALYAFGTPVFFRTGYLNHNLMLGHLAFMGLLALWSERPRYFLAGLAGGASLLMDYSGVVMLLGLFGYAIWKGWPRMHGAIWYVIGTLGPVGLLWLYQWRSFGDFLHPGQHWMPPVEWIDVGYQGFGWPQLDILRTLLFDYRYGLFVTCPLFLLALAAPFLKRRGVPARELAFLLGLPAALWLFCGGISYTRLQYNTGIRYLAPVFPFLFVPAAMVLARLPVRLAYAAGVLAVAQAWCTAMYRDVERGMGVLDPMFQVLLGGFKLPLLTVLSRMPPMQEYFAAGISPLPLFALAAALLYGVWSLRFE